MAAITTIPTLSKSEFIQQFNELSAYNAAAVAEYDLNSILAAPREELQLFILPLYSSFLPEKKRRATKRGTCYFLIIYGLQCLAMNVEEGEYHPTTNPSPKELVAGMTPSAPAALTAPNAEVEVVEPVEIDPNAPTPLFIAQSNIRAAVTHPTIQKRALKILADDYNALVEYCSSEINQGMKLVNANQIGVKVETGMVMIGFSEEEIVYTDGKAIMSVNPYAYSVINGNHTQESLVAAAAEQAK